jgi:hypothetical protein
VSGLNLWSPLPACIVYVSAGVGDVVLGLAGTEGVDVGVDDVIGARLVARARKESIEEDETKETEGREFSAKQKIVTDNKKKINRAILDEADHDTNLMLLYLVGNSSVKISQL